MASPETYSTVKQWLGRLAKATAYVQINLFKAWMKWLYENGGQFSEYNPDQLVEYQKEHQGYDILDKAQQYVIDTPGTFHTKSTRYNNIRSFFMHNRAALPKDPGFNINPELEPIQGTLTPEEIKLNILSSNALYQAVYLSMFQSAMDQEMLTYWNLNGYDNLVKQLRNDPDVLQIYLPGRKKNRNKKPFYSFIGRDAIEAIKNWLKHRPADASAIFVNQYGRPITKNAMRQYWVKHLRRLNIVDPIVKGTKATKTGKGLHEMRDVFRSLWSKSPAGHVVAEYCMGHSIDKLNYDKSFRDVDFYQEEYMKATPYLNLISSGSAFGRVEKTELDKLRTEVQQLEAEKTNRIANLESMIEQLSQTLSKVMLTLEENEG